MVLMSEFNKRDVKSMKELGVDQNDLRSVRASLQEEGLDETIFVLKLSQRYGLVSLNGMSLVDCIAYMKRMFTDRYLEVIQSLIDEFSQPSFF